MALASTIEWDVRTTGNDTNGGGFKSGATGTDYSLQDSAQVTFTDLVIGATTTQITSAAQPFTSAHVGNIINITSGSGFTTGRYEVVSVASAIATMDRSVGTAASTGGNGKLGGALLTIATANTPAVDGNTIHIKAGTYTITTAIALATTSNLTFAGYNTTHFDYGTKPLITTATNSVHIFTIAGGTSTKTFLNLSLSSTAGTRGNGIHDSAGGTFPTVIVINCLLDGFGYGILGDNSIASAIYECVLVNTEVKNCVNNGVYVWGGIHCLEGCWIHANGSDGLKSNGNFVTTGFTVRRSRITNNGGKGINGTSTSAVGILNVSESTIANNTGDGIGIGANTFWLAAGLNCQIINSIFYGNGGYGINLPSGRTTHLLRATRNNAFGSNTSGASVNTTGAGYGDVTLTADPFTDASNGDYSLNNTSGGGASCRGAGV